MGRCNQGTVKWNFFGGIISLARFSEEHCEALEYDLLTRTNYSVNDLGGSLEWTSLQSFIKNLDTRSALARELGKSTGWEDTLTTNRILADIYDLLQAINENIMRLGGGKKKKIKPYPRPNDKDKNKIGKGGLSLEDLRKWIKEKKENGKR